MKTLRSITALLVVMVSFGCQSPIQPVTEDGAQSVQFDMSEAMPMGRVPAAVGTPLADHRHPEYQQAFTEVFVSATKIMEPAQFVGTPHATAPFAEQDALARRALEEATDASPAVRWMVEQTLAMDMLRAWLSEPGAHPEPVGYYADLLLSQKNPNADVLLAAFEEMEGTWSDAQLADARSRAADAAISYLQRTGHEGNRMNEAARAYTQDGQGLAPRKRAIADAIAALTADQ